MIAIIDYGAGNLTSVRLAFQTLGIDAEITDQPDTIRSADRVVFPGVGAAGASMATLHSLGLVDAIRDVAAQNTPFLGICVGTQVAFERSEEDQGVECMACLQVPSNSSDPPTSSTRYPRWAGTAWPGARSIRSSTA